MTKEKAKTLLPIITAFAEGRTVQWQSPTGSWIDCNPAEEIFDKHYEFRIKPEPKLRAWAPGEVAVGAQIRVKGTISRGLIIGAGTNGGVFFSSDGGQRKKTREEALEFYEHSTDGGKTWLPCGISEGA